jgi:hypothetical protein
VRDVGGRQRREQSRPRRQRARRFRGVRRQEPDHAPFPGAWPRSRQLDHQAVLANHRHRSQKAEEEGEEKRKKKSKPAEKPAKEAKGGAKKPASAAKKGSKAKSAAKETA